MEVTRFEWGQYGGMSELGDGDWVRYSDHLATVQSLQARIVELEGIVSLVNEVLPTIKTASSDSRNQLFALIELTKEPK